MSDRLLRTERLGLRPVSAADVDAMHSLFTDARVRRYLWDDRVIDRSEAAEVAVRSAASFGARGFGHWALRESADGPLVGVAGLQEFGDASEVEVLYALAPELWGHGLAIEATRAVLDHGFASGIERIHARIDPPNGASIRLAERLGMQPLGDRPGSGDALAHFVLSPGDEPG